MPDVRFKPIVGYENEYLIYEDGRVFSIRNNKFLALAPNKNIKYLQVNLWKNNKGKMFYIHRLVAIHFIPNPNNLPEVNHIDGNRQNNSISNLEWVSSLGNKEHAIRTGLRKYTNRLSKQEFIVLLDRVIAGESYQDLTKEVNYKVPFLSTKLRALAKELGKEDLLNESLIKQRNTRAIRNLINSGLI